MRLIDADVLREDMQWSIDHGMYDKPYDYLAAIDDAQTIDAVEVVRCRDCKFYDRHYGYCHNDVFGDGHANYSPPCPHDDDYCSFGVRREDGE